MKLPFSAENLLHVYTVVHSKREPGVPFLKGNHYLSLRKSLHPQTRFQRPVFKHRSIECRDAIQAVNNKKSLRSVADILVYKPIYRYVIPHKAKELERIRLPPLGIEGRAPHRDAFRSKSFGAELDVNPLTELMFWKGCQLKLVELHLF